MCALCSRHQSFELSHRQSVANACATTAISRCVCAKKNKKQVNAIDEKDLKMRFGVKKYPTLQYFHAGQVEVYTGARDLDSIVHFLDHMVRPRTAQ